VNHETLAAALLALTVVFGASAPATAQQPAAPTGQPAVPPPPALPQGDAPYPPVVDDPIAGGEIEEQPARRLVSWNEYDGRHFSIRLGGGYLYDFVSYSQDDASKEQFDLSSEWKMRDARVLFSGRLKFIERPTTWSAGVMYDAGQDKWVFRQTGVVVAVPEIWGHLWVGRTKEGFSMNKVMIGYAGWTMERAPVNDAMLPILADGVKWLGYLPKAHLIWNLGFYGDSLSEGQSFSTYENQLSGRLAWVPMLSEDGGTLLHLGVSGRLGKPKDGKLRLRARPGAWAAPYFVDTQQFDAEGTTMTGIEMYYRPGPLTFGSEIFMQSVDAPEAGDPFFYGGEAFASWFLTGETRSYNIRGGYFNMVSPLRPVFSGGPGAWEIVAHGSYTDLDSKTITGGKYWRLTPMLNWYLSDHMRLETIYGYGSLDRFGIVGKTHFFQTRLQFTL
jgi:phosphate-selective porin OprO and OprP